MRRHGLRSRGLGGDGRFGRAACQRALDGRLCDSESDSVLFAPSSMLTIPGARNGLSARNTGEESVDVAHGLAYRRWRGKALEAPPMSSGNTRAAKPRLMAPVTHILTPYARSRRPTE
jgi:hypothetical protein